MRNICCFIGLLFAVGNALGQTDKTRTQTLNLTEYVEKGKEEYANNKKEFLKKTAWIVEQCNKLNSECLPKYSAADLQVMNLKDEDYVKGTFVNKIIFAKKGELYGVIRNSIIIANEDLIVNAPIISSLIFVKGNFKSPYISYINNSIVFVTHDCITDKIFFSIIQLCFVRARSMPKG